MTESGLKIAASIADNVNLAFYQNAVPIVRELSLENGTGRDLTSVQVHLSSEPPFVTPGVWRVERIDAADVHHLRIIDLKLDHGFLAGLTESRRSEIRIRVLTGEEALAESSVEVNLLPPSHWGGTLTAPELLAAFVRPNDPNVDVILREASEKLAEKGRDAAIDGYAKKTKARAWEIADAIWAALVGHGIAYVLPPKSFEQHGQPVRGPSDILTRKVGTCLDLALLYASCLEQAGLNPLIVLLEGHAFTGFWLKDEEFSSPVVDDAQMLRKRHQLQEMILVEVTGLCGPSPARLKQAAAEGAKHIADDARKAFEAAIDVKRARKASIRPLDLSVAAAVIRPNAAATRPVEIDEPPNFEEDFDHSAPAPERQLDRLEKWKASLLDLSLRNRLLNFKDGKNAITIECHDAARLEDLLAAGRRFKIQGRPSVLDGHDGRDPALIMERMNEDARRAYVAESMEREELFAEVPDAELEARLTELYRATRLAFEEGGANVLYLCLGFLKWAPQDGAGPYRAPLVLVPVQLERKSVRSGFRLTLHEDEPRFNPTLLQMLRIDHNLLMPDLEGDLPRDGSGVDLPLIWRKVRAHVKELKGWELTEEVVIATLSFTRYLMWKDLVDRTEDLKRNPVVRHLIDTPTFSYAGSGSDFVDPSMLDAVVEPADLFTPLPADSSQIAAVVAAQRGKDFVLFGPPGTGKSQTITNMIANLLAHGKTVLFVSQKTAALEVVRRRLASIGLGSYCLECHSNKAQKSSVIGQLADAWRSRGTSTEEHWAEATSQLRRKRDELNALVSALHRRRECGISAYQAFGRVIAGRDALPQVHFVWPAGTVHKAEAQAAMRETCSDLRTALAAVGDPTLHPLRGMEQTRWNPAWSATVLRLAEALKAAIENLASCINAFASSIGFTEDNWNPDDLHLLEEFGSMLMRPEAADGALLLGADEARRTRALRAAVGLVRRADAKRAELSAPYDLKAIRLDLAHMQADWADACASNFLVRNGRKNRVRVLLQPYCAVEVPEDIGRDLLVLQGLGKLDAEAACLASEFAGMERLWQGLETDARSFELVIGWAAKAREAAHRLGARYDNGEELVVHMALLLTDYGELFAPEGNSRRAFENFQATFASARALALELGSCIGLEEPAKIFALQPNWICELPQTLSRWTAHLIKAPQWARWRTAAAAARAAGIAPLVAAVEAGTVSGDLIAPVFEFAYATWCAAEIVNADEVLSSFLAQQHEATIDAFAAADARVAELSKEIVRTRISSGVPTITNFGSDPEWGTLSGEVNRRAAHMPLRQLFGKIPNVLTTLAPCVMMSPLSIAQYLPPGSKPFDVVIFDEASQIPVWEAIGAIARGNQVVVVGDPEQLPPTSVGQRAASGEEEDYDVVQTQQSILDECLACNLPSMKLSWHYRSRHESLIAFSNAKYYRGELITFPSPVTKDDAVRLIPVKNGIYDRGKSKTNRTEAEALIKTVLRHLCSSCDSIGIVTFNGEQQKLIENLLDQERRKDPSLERYFDRTQTSEPVLVKNLENVQGDERDLILFSPGVGRDSAGRITAQISSLNGEGGHRRLNVAITRARKELLVFSSLLPHEIDLGRSSARGVVDYKHFLEFAERGARAIAEAFAPTGRDTESPFEEAVKRGLESKGWKVIPQIGVSFFRIDLGVVNPDCPSAFLAGIEADGAQYHSSASARDRDLVRQRALENLSWRIRRIWSTEWWIDSAAALEKLHQRLLADLEEDRAARAAASQAETANAADDEPAACDAVDFDTPNVQVGPELNSRKERTFKEVGDDRVSYEEESQRVYADGPASQRIQSELPRSYEFADPCDVGTPDRERFYDNDYRPELRKMVDYVVEKEAPVYFDVIVERISRAHGFQRAKDQIRGIIRQALGRGRYPISQDAEREIVWPKDWDASVPPEWRSSARRKHEDIPLPELASLAARLRANGYEGEDLVRSMQEHFSLGRLAASTRERFEAAVALTG
jgi:hypothetical protein